MSEKRMNEKRIAAAFVATILISVSLCGCSGRKMSNMEPLGETVEVEVTNAEASDSTEIIPTEDTLTEVSI